MVYFLRLSKKHFPCTTIPFLFYLHFVLILFFISFKEFPMQRRYLLSAVVLLLLAACSTSPHPDALADSVATDTLLGIAEVSNDAVSVQALVPGLSFAVIDRSFTDADGVRVQEVVYEIDNTSERDLSNLTLYAVATPNTLAGTNVSNLRDALGNEITDPDMAPSIVSVHGSDADNADMQAFTEADKVRVKGLLDDIYPDNSFSVLSRGFVASNTTGQGDRAIAMGEKGVVTIAVQYPFDPANPAGYPDSFVLTFAFVDEEITRVTQGDDESNEAFVNRVTSTFESVPADLEVVTPNPQDPPQFAGNPTMLESEPQNPPITSAPTTPTTELPTRFTLTVAGVNATADTEITVSISPNVQSNVEVQE
jgi:hypothetical protein